MIYCYLLLCYIMYYYGIMLSVFLFNIGIILTNGDGVFEDDTLLCWDNNIFYNTACFQYKAQVAIENRN